MSKDLEGAVRAQFELYGRIARAFDNLKKAGAANVTLGLVEARLQALEANWAKFEAQHDRLNGSFWEVLSESDYQKKDLPSLAEEAYLQQKGLFLDAVRTLRTPATEATTVVSTGPHPPRTTLPRIQLPQFSGRFEEWPSFRDLFYSIIGKDTSATNVEKLHYLKSCLKGEATLLVRNLPTIGENFDRAWKILTDHFENKRLLVRSYFSQFTALQKLKGESVADLRKLKHCVMSTVGSLESIGRPITRGEDLFVHLVIELLDSRSRREWENSISDNTEPPSYAVLQQFLDRRLQTLESLQPVKTETEAARTSANPSRQTRALHARKQDNKRGRCSLCSKDHYIIYCDEYLSKAAAERKRHAETNDLCLNCLGRHKLSDCSSQKTCSTCHARHHTTLHDAFSSNETVTTSHFARKPSEAPVAVLLATARVRVADRFGVTHTARALIDQGSESSLVSESLAQRLRLPRERASIAVYGVGGIQTGFSHGQVTLKIRPLEGGSSMIVTALVFPRLTLYDGGIKTNLKAWKHLQGLKLADPDCLSADPVDILLGADVCASILQPGLRKGGLHSPIAQQTTLGWILSGSVGKTSAPCRALTHQCRVEEDLFNLVRGFWQQEETPLATPPLTPEDQECENHFARTHSRAADGRYVVRLPVTSPLADLSATRRSALILLTRMEKRFTRDATLRQLYISFMRQYEELGHMSRIEHPEISIDRNRVSYLPHHGVMREASTTTKLRVVYNGSTITSTGESLNKHLLVGPNLLPPLVDVLLRWRAHKYVLATDIEKMFRQILVHPEDRDLQRIIWRDNDKEEFREYRLNTVTYGLACAPFLAIRTLHQLAADEQKTYPEGARVLFQNVYMDDVLTGASTIEETLELQRQLIGICTAGGFPLRKWSANEPTLLSNIPNEHRMQHELLDWRSHETHATLGLQWHPGTDSFSFSTRTIAITTITKRSVLSLMARLFDPLGWLAPVVVSAKIAFQSTWLEGLDWDVALNETSARQWLKFQAELPLLEQIRVPRWIGLDREANIEIHGFADASERAYAAVIYLRASLDRSTKIYLIAAKTKVAPLKQISLPRLELCAALLLVRFAAHIQRTLECLEAPLHLWTDSTVALGWIKGHPTRWKTYIANRVAEIQTTVPKALWRHIPGRDNPADCASRGLSPEELVAHPIWWQGPSWLQAGPSQWPISKTINDDEDLPEKRSRVHAARATRVLANEAVELLRFSSLNRLLRVTAWCRRWLRRRSLKEPASAETENSPGDVLSVAELDDARHAWIKQVQAVYYATEIKILRQGRALAQSNSLIRLNPLLDPQGILRVGGRLKHAILAFDERHPVILPSESHFTRLIVEACHRRALHGGVQLTLGMIRQHFWIPRGRSLVKRLILRCVTCVRWRAAVPQQLMGNLPRERVTPARPFLNTGVDYAGPILLRTAKGRGHKAYKAFIAVFVCLSTRAVHLEVASDYTADAFLAALRRFVSRRGLCSTIYSDCGTNFVGADKQLRALFSASGSERGQIFQRLAADNIRWRFNPPSAPHFGGIWEAAVKSIKHHLRRVLGDATLTFEEMTTLLTQIEACLNSRPLQAITDDPEDLAALTPGHFLIGSPLTAVPEPTLLDLAPSRLTRWQLLQKMRDHFWERWSREYLHSLVHRPKWCQEDSSFDIGRLCLIRHENAPPTRWPLARIIRIHPGEDGKVRVVTVRTSASEFTRPITKLILLPVSQAEVGEKTTT